MMTNKKFDCVEMKRKGADAVQSTISKLSREEELRFWQKGTAELENLKKEVEQKSAVLQKT